MKKNKAHSVHCPEDRERCSGKERSCPHLCRRRKTGSGKNYQSQRQIPSPSYTRDVQSHVRWVPLNHLLLYQNKSQKKSGQSSLFQEFLLNLTVYTEVRSLPSWNRSISGCRYSQYPGKEGRCSSSPDNQQDSRKKAVMQCVPGKAGQYQCEDLQCRLPGGWSGHGPFWHLK